MNEKIGYGIFLFAISKIIINFITELGADRNKISKSKINSDWESNFWPVILDY